MARTYLKTIKEVTVETVNDMLLQSASPDDITGEILERCMHAVLMHNEVAQLGDKWKVPVSLFPFQIAYLVLQFHHVVLLDTKTSNGRRDHMELAFYVEDGPEEGIYTTYRTHFSRMIRPYKWSIQRREVSQVMNILREEAPKSKLCTDDNLVAMNNGIYNKNTKELMPFTPNLVFLEKSDEDYNPNSDEKLCE